MTFRRRQRSKQHHAAHEGEQPHPEPLGREGVPEGPGELISEINRLSASRVHAKSTAIAGGPDSQEVQP